MNRAIIGTRALCLLSAAIALPLPSAGAPPRPSASPPQEITVTLFGQPCQLAGPLDRSVLKEIHAISPEQIYPVETTAASIDSVRKSLEKLKSARATPPVLDRYRDRLLKRLETEIAFHEGFAAARKAKKSEPLLASIAKFTQGKRTKAFDALVKKTDFAASSDSEAGTQILELLLDAVEPDPEEEFHRAIQRLNVQYTCVFADEISGAGEDDEARSAPDSQ